MNTLQSLHYFLSGESYAMESLIDLRCVPK